MQKKLNIILIILMCLLLLPINVLAQSYGKTGASTNFNGDVGVPSGSSYYVNNVEMVKFSKWDATVPPDADNDTTEGYKPGSTWIDLTGDRHYVCLDNTDGDAIWEATDTMWVRADEEIKKGDPVYISGALGSARPKIKLVDADLAVAIRMIGIAVQDIAFEANGFIRVHGAVKDVDTEGATDANPGGEAWGAGDLLYCTLDGGGGFTNARPTSGRVIKAGYTLLGHHVDDTIFVLTHVNAVDLAAAATENIRMRLGDAIGGTKVTIKDFNDAEVAFIDSDGNISIATGATYQINEVQVTSAILSDRANIAMLDEQETITGGWTFDTSFSVERLSDSNNPYMMFSRKRGGGANVVSGDILADWYFNGYYNTYIIAAEMKAIVDGDPGVSDMPGRLEFLTTPDGSANPNLRMAIDSTGNIKMGDGAWTDYVNVNVAGVLSFEGAAAVETVPFSGVHAIGNSGATETVDWRNGAYQSITIDEACVISFSNEYVGTLNLRVTYAGSFALTFDGGITLLEEGGVEIVTTDASGVDVLMFKNWGVADTYDMGALLDVKD